MIKYQIVSKANIILFGTSNSGKTTTLRILYYLLTGKTAPKSTHRIQDRYKGMTIDFAFDGDNLEVVESNVAFFENNPCDIAVSPTRTDGGPVLAMNYFIDKTLTTTENVIWKRIPEISKSNRTVKMLDADSVNLAEEYPQSYSNAVILKEIIDKLI